LQLSGRELDFPPPKGWVTVFGRINYLSISPSQPSQLSLLHSVERQMTTSKSEVTFCGPEVNAYLSALELTAHDKCWTNKAYFRYAVMGICDTSLQNMSLTHSVTSNE